MNCNLNEEDLFHIFDYMDEIDNLSMIAYDDNILGEINYCPQEACKQLRNNLINISKLSDNVYEVFKRVITNSIGGNN